MFLHHSPLNSPLPWCRKLLVQLPCLLLCPARQQEQRPGVHGRRRRSASRGGGEAPGWWHSGWWRPPPHSGLQTGSRCLKVEANPGFSITTFHLKKKKKNVAITRDSSGDSAPQSRHRCHGDFLRGELLGAAMSSSHHVGFQQCSLQVHMVVRQSLVDGC